MLNNVLLMTDVYKMGHLEQYPEDTEEVYSYLEARKPGKQVVFFGLQYLLKEYLSRPISRVQADEFLTYYRRILGPVPETTKNKIYALADLRYWPVEIKAAPEGAVIPSGNVLMTVRNTKPGFHWCVGFLESLLLKIWNPCTVATCSLQYRELVEKYATETCDNADHVPFQVHDFGYRGVSSEESAMIAGAAHLLNFKGSDTITANKFLDEYYPGADPAPVLGLSVPASEHSVMCSYGREGELDAFRHMLKTYPTGFVSIVSDTYDLWNVLENFTEELRADIESRDGRVVFRPDSGNPIDIICGDPSKRVWSEDRQCWVRDGSPESKGALQILWEKFGGHVNSKGYKVLNPKVGLIYGDGMTQERFDKILERMKAQGFASSNLVIGVGGILLQSHNRDELGFALKATHIIRAGSRVNIFKDPVTDPGKKSKCGLMKLELRDGQWKTTDQVDEVDERTGMLQVVFRDGHLFSHCPVERVKANLNETRGIAPVVV